MAWPVLRLLVEVQFETDEAAEVEDEVEDRLEVARERIKLVELSTGLEDAVGCCGSGLASDGTAGAFVAS